MFSLRKFSIATSESVDLSPGGKREAIFKWIYDDIDPFWPNHSTLQWGMQNDHWVVQWCQVKAKNMPWVFWRLHVKHQWTMLSVCAVSDDVLYTVPYISAIQDSRWPYNEAMGGRGHSLQGSACLDTAISLMNHVQNVWPHLHIICHVSQCIRIQNTRSIIFFSSAVSQFMPGV